MSRPFRFAGITAGLILVAFGVGAIVIGIAGRSEVNASIKQEQIVRSPDMKPGLIAVAAKKAGLKNVALPTCDVANKAITNGGDAKCFASYMRIHALEATGGKTYAQMPQYSTADGRGTSVAAKALEDPKTGGPQSNPARQIWISETALGTALNTSFFASSVGMFAIVMGAALLLTGIGFYRAVHRPDRPRGTAPPDLHQQPGLDHSGPVALTRADVGAFSMTCMNNAPACTARGAKLGTWAPCT